MKISNTEKQFADCDAFSKDLNMNLQSAKIKFIISCIYGG